MEFFKNNKGRQKGINSAHNDVNLLIEIASKQDGPLDEGRQDLGIFAAQFRIRTLKLTREVLAQKLGVDVMDLIAFESGMSKNYSVVLRKYTQFIDDEIEKKKK